LWAVGAITRAMPLYDSDELVSFLPLCHIAERMFSVFIHLFFEYTINFIENTDTVTQNIIEISPTVMFAVPRIWEKYSSTIVIKMKDANWFKRLCFQAAYRIGRRYAEARLTDGGAGPRLRLAYRLAHFLVFGKLKERLGLERIRVAISGAAPISPEVLKFYHAIGIPLRQVYGQTEGTGIATIHQKDEIEADNVGPPFPGIEVAIAEDGEVLVRGGCVFMGYYKNTEATAETVVDGWLHSGDVGEMDDRGFLKITDRKKDLIITSGGKNIAPQYIENKLKFSPFINDAVVVGDNRKYIAALIFIDEDNVVKFAQEQKVQFSTYANLTRTREINDLIWREIKDVNQTLAQVEQIKKFRIIPKKLIQEDGEVTPTMKLKRKYINETYKELIDEMY
jgi:long-chain acyl-CoA synthetase